MHCKNAVLFIHSLTHSYIQQTLNGYDEYLLGAREQCGHILRHSEYHLE